MTSECELRLDQLLPAVESKLVQAPRLECQDSVVCNIGERVPTPELERGAEPVGGETGGAAAERFASVVEERLETSRVDPIDVDLERVPRRTRDDRVVGKRRAQA